MASDSFKVEKSLNIKPKTSPSLTAEGDIGVNSGSNSLQAYLGSSARTVATTDQTQTLTNKTIDADANTITNIDNADIKTGAAIDAAKIADGSVSSTEFQYLSGVTSDIQTQLDSKITENAGAIVDADISASANIADTKLATISTSGKVSNSATTAASANTASAIVARDGSGNFSAGTITASLTGVASGNIANTLLSTTGDTIYASANNTPARLAIGANGKVLKSNGTIPTWGDAEGGGGINYISANGGNDKFETDTSGWSTYADAAGSAPVDGTGGSPTLTLTRTTSSPLRGTGSGLITKDAANRQGEGASYAFTIDSADQAKVLAISFDYTVASGTYATGDLAVYIYDVTNAAVLQPAGFSVQNVTTGLPSKHIATFQTASNSTSYRLIIHTASTSASAYTVKIDNVSVGPQAVQYGAPVTDWTAYSPTILGFGTISNNSAYWRRVGDSVEVYGTFTSGTQTAVLGVIPMPSGLSIGTVSINNTTSNPGPSVGLYTNGTNNNQFGYLVTATGTSTSNIYLGATLGAGSGLFLTPQLANGLISGTPVVSYSFRVPVLGWSSTVQMSNDTDTRVVSAYYNGTPTGTLAGSFNTTTFPTKIDDSHGAYSSGTYTVPVSGRYDVAAAVTITATWTVNSRAILALFVNGSEVARGPWFKAEVAATTSHTTQISLNSYPLNAGDAVTIRAFSDATTPTYVASESTYFNISRRSGPSAIAASESVTADYYRNAVQAITSGATGADIIWDTKRQDSHNAMNASTGVYTCPVSGMYDVKSHVVITSTAFNGTSGEYIQMEIRKNGTAYQVSVRRPYSGEVDPWHSIAGLVRCLAGDTLSIRYIQVSGTNENTVGGVGYCSVGIARVGNY